MSAQPIPGLREIHWVAADWLLAAVLLVLSVGGVASRTPVLGVPVWLTVTAAALVAVPLAVRRVFPIPVLLVVLAANTVVTVAGVVGDPAVPVGFAMYTVAVANTSRRSLPLAGVALVITSGAGIAQQLEAAPWGWRVTIDLICASVLVVVASWATGAAMRAQRRYTMRSAEEMARRAVAEERLRIARELHDVISHSMSLITVKASVTNYLIDEQPEQARAALSVIEEAGRRALVEMRQLLGVLRADDQESLEPPPETDLATLAADARQAGVDVELDVADGLELPEAMATSVYRIVQEALTNAVKHAAPTRCRVVVGAAEDQVVVDVCNEGRGSPRIPIHVGHGIMGMRERAAVFGGELEAGHTPDGGFRVTARLPTAPGQARPQ